MSACQGLRKIVEERGNKNFSGPDNIYTFKEENFLLGTACPNQEELPVSAQIAWKSILSITSDVPCALTIGWNIEGS